MKSLSWLFILVSAVLTALANMGLRYGLIKSGGVSFEQGEWLAGWCKTLLQPAFLTGVILYGLAAVVWFYALSVTEVSTGYPILVGFVFVMVTAGAVVVFHEALNPLKMAGMALILIGIACVARSS